jgi:hypothetical protein
MVLVLRTSWDLVIRESGAPNSSSALKELSQKKKLRLAFQRKLEMNVGVNTHHALTLLTLDLCLYYRSHSCGRQCFSKGVIFLHRWVGGCHSTYRRKQVGSYNPEGLSKTEWWTRMQGNCRSNGRKSRVNSARICEALSTAAVMLKHYCSHKPGMEFEIRQDRAQVGLAQFDRPYRLSWHLRVRGYAG